MPKQSVFVILGILACLNILAWIGVWQVSQPYLEVTFFDVGQGDAIFIETPSGHQILIDGGSTSVILEKLGREMPFWDRTIDLVVLSHPEKDHMAGLIDVLKRYEVDNILWTGIIRDTAEYAEWQRLLKKEKAAILIAQAGQRVEAGSVSLSVLYPLESLAGQEFKDSNNTSVVIRLVYGENSFLFTGDAAKSVENEIIESGYGAEADVLKVGHHGSKTSTGPEFLEAVSPETAVIQVGRDNPYGHPASETLASLANYGIKVLRTDLNGDIKILCNLQSSRLVFRD